MIQVAITYGVVFERLCRLQMRLYLKIAEECIDQLEHNQDQNADDETKTRLRNAKCCHVRKKTFNKTTISIRYNDHRTGNIRRAARQQ